MMKSTLLLSVPFVMVACAPSGEYDSRKVSRTSIKCYVDDYRKPPVRVLFNEHPAAAIQVTYEVTEPDTTKHKRDTVIVKAFETVVIGSEQSREKIISTDFDDPSRRSQ